MRTRWRKSSTFHMFLPTGERGPVPAFPVRWFGEKELGQFYGDPRFPNAILDSYHPERPDRLAVCAYDGERIMGMAGCSEDAPGWFQIGIDVEPEYRSRGVATGLVSLLKERILEEGGIPFLHRDAIKEWPPCFFIEEVMYDKKERKKVL